MPIVWDLDLVGWSRRKVDKSRMGTMGYQAALYFEAALAGIALLFDVFSVKMQSDARERWQGRGVSALDVIEEIPIRRK